MIDILGEYQATLDSKGRFLLPAAFKKQLSEEEGTRFVFNRGLDNCVTLFTLKNWEAFAAKIRTLNDFNEEERPVRRFFLNGAAYVEPDTAGRLLVPQHLKEHAGLQKDLVMHWADDKLEIWDSNKYKQLFDSISPEALSKMVHKVLGGGNSPGS